MNDAAYARAKGWKVGDLLQDEHGRQMLVTAIGDEGVLARWRRPGDESFGYEHVSTFTDATWRKIMEYQRLDSPP